MIKDRKVLKMQAGWINSTNGYLWQEWEESMKILNNQSHHARLHLHPKEIQWQKMNQVAYKNIMTSLTEIEKNFLIFDGNGGYVFEDIPNTAVAETPKEKTGILDVFSKKKGDKKDPLPTKPDQRFKVQEGKTFEEYDKKVMELMNVGTIVKY